MGAVNNGTNGFDVAPDHGVPVARGGDALWSDCRTVLAMAAALDWAVGSVVEGLKEAQLYGCLF